MFERVMSGICNAKAGDYVKINIICFEINEDFKKSA